MCIGAGGPLPFGTGRRKKWTRFASLEQRQRARPGKRREELPTPALVLDEVLPELGLVLVMTVDPGFGGQDFIAGAVPKIRRIRALLDRLRPECELEVDGGIHLATAPVVVEAGARVLVAGSAVFEDPGGIHAAMARLRASAAGAESAARS